MRYKSFHITNYRAISEELIVSLDKNSLIPIIGINECGKTTILLGIFSFDLNNDIFNEAVRHLEDTVNLYKPGENINPKIAAKIEISTDELLAIFDDSSVTANEISSQYKEKISDLCGELIVSRNLISRAYTLEHEFFGDPDLNNLIAQIIIRKLPNIIYFDDFRDQVPPEIDIDDAQRPNPSGWLAIIERLFKKTDDKFSVFDLEIDDRLRKSIISKVTNALNKTLTDEWQNFKLDDKDALKIHIEYIPKSVEGEISKPAKIKFEIIEKDNENEDHYFYIRDRSKGFYWFFNFVMKTEFNPKITSNAGIDAIYLLDEPGSYLHAAAQEKLCAKLAKLSEDNKVIYCTHSHYLLNPEKVPLSSVRIAEKVGKNLTIKLFNIYERDSGRVNRNAFQPIFDALQIAPFSLDIQKNNVIIVEGIYDFYCFKMLLDQKYQFLPSKNADSVLYFISLMLGWNIKFNALWDNDVEGQRYHKEAGEKFSGALKDKFLLLPLIGKRKSTILQDLFSGDDMQLIKNELCIPANSSFEKVIMTLYYSKKKAGIIKKISLTTKSNFSKVQKLFDL